MILRRAWTPATTRLLQLALSLLSVEYMLVIGGTLGASLIYNAQMLNLVGSAALGLGWLLARLLRRQRMALPALGWAVLLFVAAQWLALSASNLPRLGLDWVTQLTAWAACYLIVMDVLAHGWPRAFWINALLVVAVIVAADGLVEASQWLAGWLALGTLPPVPFRFNGLLGIANLAACVINLLWPIVLARLAQTGRLLQRLGLGLLVAALAVTLFFTSSRAGWLATAVSGVALAAMMVYTHGGADRLRAWRAGWQRSSLFTRWATIGVALLVVAAGVWLLAKESQQISHASLAESRGQFWAAAWDEFKTRPLTGVGPDLYGWYYARYASIPPDFFAPHAHSLIFQILSGSGLMGLAALLVLASAAAVQLWRRWEAAGRTFELACLIAALLSFGVQQLFDFLVTPTSLIIVIVLLALALAPRAGEAAPCSAHPLLAAPLIVLPIAIFAFLLQGSASNNAAIQLAQAGQWPAAARAFEQTAQADPQLTVYWEEAAYAYTRAGDVPAALPLWDRAARDDPNWSLLPATLGALRQDLAAAQAARSLAPRSYLFALNAGAIAEGQGDTAAAQEAYRAALHVKPSIAAALFWQQTSFRSGVLAGWQSSLPPDHSAVAKGWTALAGNAPAQAVSWFQQAAAQDPNALSPELGLGQAYLQLGNISAAQHAARAGLALPVVNYEDSLPLDLLAGDVADASGNRAGAEAEYGLVYSAIADYGIDGPGSFEHPERNWFVYHRQVLPSELVPQLPRADVTADMDRRFAKLAQWYHDEGQKDIACLILGRVYQEAPQSVSGSAFLGSCPRS